jgi:hypothetical protein
MSDDNPSERSDLLSGDDANAPVLPKSVDEPPPKASVPAMALAKQSRKTSLGGERERVVRGVAFFSLVLSQPARCLRKRASACCAAAWRPCRSGTLRTPRSTLKTVAPQWPRCLA